MTRHDPKATRALEALLYSLFSHAELLHVLRRVGDRELLDALPLSTGQAELIDAAVSALSRRGLLDAALFDALEHDRPGRSSEIRAVRAMFLAQPAPPMESLTLRAASTPAPAAPPDRLRINQIFRTVGPPDVTAVAPAQLPDLEVRLGFMAEGLVVDGPSGVGKSTAVRLALAAALGEPVDALIARGAVRWLQSKVDTDRAALSALLDAGPRALRGHLIIDDFHLLDPALQARVADAMKALADLGSPDAKIVVIGINPVGQSLVREFPDLAGRFTVISLGKQPDARIDTLIQQGEAAANIVFEQRPALVRAARGSFFTAQMLCLEVALFERIHHTSPTPRRVVTGPDAVIDRVLQKLKFKFHEPLISFASYGEVAPPRGGALALLWLLGRASDSTATLMSAKRNFPAVGAEIDWLLSSNLSALFVRTPALSRLFFYNRDGGVLSAEDPQLEFYLNHLSWPALARDSGLSVADWDTDHRPIFEAQSTRRVARPSPWTPLSPLPRSTLLHLSDLHIDSRDRAFVWGDQLLADLRTELGLERLDAVILSGDIGNTATPEEYDAADLLIRMIKDEFKLSPGQFVLVPGNHDLSWSLSRHSYREVRRQDHKEELIEGEHVLRGDLVDVADPALRRARFQPFADFYFGVRAEAWPLDYEYQATLHHYPAQRLLVLGLNSSWNIDHAHPHRADIHDVALGRALQRIRMESAFHDCLKIAVWHHPIQSPDPDRLRDTGFIERLVQAGFRLGLHGHIHKPQAGLFRYDMSADGRRMDFLGAGTFGAPVREWQPGYPLQYQILEIEGDTVTVRSRRREELNGAWKPDARFTPGPGEEPRSSYWIKL